MMLTFNAEALSMEANEQLFKKILEVWKDIPSSVGMYKISLLSDELFPEATLFLKAYRVNLGYCIIIGN